MLFPHDTHGHGHPRTPSCCSGGRVGDLPEPRLPSRFGPTLYKASEAGALEALVLKATVTDLVVLTTAFMRCLQPVWHGRSPWKSLSF